MQTPMPAVAGDDMRAYFSAILFAFLVLVLLFACQKTPLASSPTAPPEPTGIPTELSLPAATPASTVEAASPPLTGAGGQSDLMDALLPAARIDAPDPAELARYGITLEIAKDYLRFSGQMRVSVPNNSHDEWALLHFRLFPNAGKTYGDGSLQVDKVMLGERRLPTQLSANDSVLQVQLPEPLLPGERVELVLDFRGKVSEDFGGEQGHGYGIYNFSDGVLALSGWFPMLAVYDQAGWHLDPVSLVGDSVYSEMAYYSVEVFAPADAVLAATGAETRREIIDSLARYEIVTGPVRDFFLALSPEFELLSREVSGTVVNAYFYSGEQASRHALEVAAGALQVFNRRFGAYPYTELDIVQAPMRVALGVEYPGIFMVAADLYQDPPQSVFTTAVVHEVAHQWWYNLVGNNVFAEPWLDEGLATYSTAVYYQEVSGLAAYLAYSDTWQSRYERLLQESDDDIPTRDLAYFEQPGKAQIYGAVVYIKSALFFKALREEIGERAFFEGLRSYFEAHHYGVAAGEDLL
jgi:hypothetical protein